MEYYARIVNGIVMEVIQLEVGQDITKMFHPDLIWVSCLSTTIQGMLYSSGVFSEPPTPPAPTILQIAQVAFAAAMINGCEIVSTSTPEFNSTYPLDDTTLLKMSGVQAQVMVSSGQSDGPIFLNGLTTQNWWDINGAIHTLPNPAFFTAFATAIAKYVEDLTTALMNVQQGTVSEWTAPAQPVSIP